MSAWDDGYAAGSEQRADGGRVELDPFEVRQQAEVYAQIAIGLYRTDAADAERLAADEWLFGFYKAALEEADYDPFAWGILGKTLKLPQRLVP